MLHSLARRLVPRRRHRGVRPRGRLSTRCPGCPGTAGQRAPGRSRLTNAPTYVYEKRGLYEFRRPDGSLRHLKEKVYEVRLYRGMTRNRLIRVDSRELAPEESQRETEGERRWRSAYTAGRTAFRDERMEDVLNEDGPPVSNSNSRVVNSFGVDRPSPSRSGLNRRIFPTNV